MTPPTSTPSVVYHLVLPSGVRVVLEAEKVLAWVEGFAAALGQSPVLEALDPGPEDTRRVQALQIGDAQRWFEYLYPEYPKS